MRPGARCGPRFDHHLRTADGALPCRSAQARNLQLALKRLQTMLDEASVTPKERIISLEPPAHIKKRRKEAKQHQSKKKQQRSRKFDG